MEQTDIDMIRRIPLADFLVRLGNEPVRRSGNELWYSTPYRSERTPLPKPKSYQSCFATFTRKEGVRSLRYLSLIHI